MNRLVVLGVAWLLIVGGLVGCGETTVPMSQGTESAPVATVEPVLGSISVEGETFCWIATPGSTPLSLETYDGLVVGMTWCQVAIRLDLIGENRYKSTHLAISAFDGQTAAGMPATVLTVFQDGLLIAKAQAGL